MTLAEIISDIGLSHIKDNNGLIIGQTLSAVGRVNNTVPDCVEGIVELPMSDTAGAGFAVGAALVGRRPIFVIRYQDFCLLNASPLVYYAAKSKEMQDVICPIFIRAISSEGMGVGHAGCAHSVFMHYPGFQVYSPMTPQEYKYVWSKFLKSNDPFFISEHRKSFDYSDEFDNLIVDNADITIYAISATRFIMEDVRKKMLHDGIVVNIIHLFELKPFIISESLINPLIASGNGLVIDIGFEISGAARSIAYDLSKATGIFVDALGLKDESKLLSNNNNIPDVESVCMYINGMIKNKRSKI